MCKLSIYFIFVNFLQLISCIPVLFSFSNFIICIPINDLSCLFIQLFFQFCFYLLSLSTSFLSNSSNTIASFSLPSRANEKAASLLMLCYYKVSTYIFIYHNRRQLCSNNRYGLSTDPIALLDQTKPLSLSIHM